MGRLVNWLVLCTGLLAVASWLVSAVELAHGAATLVVVGASCVADRFVLGATQTLIDPLWFALGALLLMLVFSAVLKDRVPLYLTNKSTHQALVELAQTYQVKSMLDLGSGLGGVVRALAKVGIEAKGVEYSPVLAWFSQVWCRWSGLGQVSRGDMWQTDLSQVDMVYVFLSPVPMTRLWQRRVLK